MNNSRYLLLLIALIPTNHYSLPLQEAVHEPNQSSLQNECNRMSLAQEILDHPDFAEIKKLHNVQIQNTITCAAYPTAFAKVPEYLIITALAIPFFITNRYVNTRSMPFGRHSRQIQPYYSAISDAITNSAIIGILHILLTFISPPLGGTIGIVSIPYEHQSDFIQYMYHEIGHIANSHYRNLLKKEPQEEDLKALERFKQYRDRAKQLFITRHEDSQGFMYSYLQPRIETMKADYLNGHHALEAHADIFALDYLWKHKRVDVIIDTICVMRYMAFHYEEIINDPHPSSIERVLCMIGFLVDKGINVLELVRKREIDPAISDTLHKRPQLIAYYTDQCKRKVVQS
jgi:hypothetical protein